jgi:hypothetical protein
VLLRVEERLRAKMRAAGLTVSAGTDILPTHADERCARDEGATSDPIVSGAAWPPSATRRRELVLRAVERWRMAIADEPAREAGAPIAAAVRAPRTGVLALVREASGYHLLAALDDAALSDDPGVVLQAVRLAGGARAPVDERALRGALRRVSLWIARRSAMAAAGVALPLQAPARQRAMRRIAAITSRAPSHRRPVLAPLAARARLAITAPYGIGAERALEELASADMSDEAWLRVVGEFGEKHVAGAEAAGSPEHALAALLVLRPAHPLPVDQYAAFVPVHRRLCAFNPLPL